MKYDELIIDKPIPDKHSCYHCGEECRDEIIQSDGHEFCCEGCSTVYDILNENNLCSYYTIDGAQGISPDSTLF